MVTLRGNRVYLRNSMSRVLNKVDQVLAKGEGTALILILSVMTLVVFLQVVFRYVLGRPLDWSEEMARYLFVWLSVLGAALGVQKGGHFGLDFLQRMRSGSGKRFVRVFVYFLMAVVVLVILFQGIKLVQMTIPQESPAMSISMAWAYASLPTGAGLMAFHLLTALIKDSVKER
jgi:TRAP-type C4-dicarboxylate transport system permease small subunit